MVARAIMLVPNSAAIRKTIAASRPCVSAEQSLDDDSRHIASTVRSSRMLKHPTATCHNAQDRCASLPIPQIS